MVAFDGFAVVCERRRQRLVVAGVGRAVVCVVGREWLGPGRRPGATVFAGTGWLVLDDSSVTTWDGAAGAL